MADYQATGRAAAGPPADVNLGRAVFAKTCQQCHTLFGTGGKVGPDLTGSNRANLDYLLSNIVDPSAVLAKEYTPSIIQTEDGRIVTGIVKAAGRPIGHRANAKRAARAAARRNRRAQSSASNR